MGSSGHADDGATPGPWLSRSTLLRGLAGAALTGWLAACSNDDPDGAHVPRGARAPDPPAETPTVAGTSVLAFADQSHRGDQLEVLRVRDVDDSWTSYDITYRVRSAGPGAYADPVRVSGVLTLPRGDGPFPFAVLAHGFIDPASYERGQGMVRERRWLGTRGWATLHTDYRGHADSDPDPTGGADVRLGYAVDVIGALDAVRRSELPVDPHSGAVFGRSMGGGVVQKAAEIAPEAVRAVVAWAAVSSLETENAQRFAVGDPARRRAFSSPLADPTTDPEFWLGVSARPYLERITAPVLSVHGRSDVVCPPQFAEDTQAAMLAAGVDAELVWFSEGHAFHDDFEAAMRVTHDFLEQHARGTS